MILYITGPSGAGKSTLAAAWVASKEREIALIDADQITSWMRHGSTSAVGAAWATGGVERPAQLYGITGEVYAAAARVYDANGMDVVIAQLCGYDPPPPWTKGWDRVEPLKPIFVVLYPEREVCQARQITRGNSLDMSSYDFDWRAWAKHPRALFLDNSNLSVAESVSAVDELLAAYMESVGPN